jgi:hypothetical protein
MPDDHPTDRYTLLLLAAGPRRLDTIAALQREAGLSPRAALAVAQQTPAPVGPLARDAAERLAAALTAAGARVEVLPAAAAAERLATLRAARPARVAPTRAPRRARLLRSGAALCWAAGAILLIFTINGWPVAVALFVLGLALLAVPSRRPPRP